ncbi:rabphilin-1-like isoform X1 [Vespa velutina]|uniref:rabphilin-1-like isoform X1 n=1 Tax=Vespa velutina TaxID=202808 RepID=UPI001FB38CA9|nr:rabphilin-1-like isoform X1 [Vespa velutina]XP_047344322.1 rabphilin-1-like isoform X1 [Vespa velutina]XP_047344323.1 rabphilin-1-like isoform X1 [Vespa velutina]XP_047344324.1 rabphilin-1-like isoform X1 [Vespa velutina]
MDTTMGEPQSTGARWVCPNDRHLALRAKLRTGWSVKTGYLDSGWDNYSNVGSANRTEQSFVLTEEERRTIIQVIQRAEALDLSEQKRIGRLVERLEDMKRNVRIITSSRSDERKNCGSRCSNGSHCVCSCALCGEKFGAVLGATPTFCKDCRKYVCQKCGREAGTSNVLASTTTTEVLSSTTCNSLTNESIPKRTAMQRIVQRTSNNSQKIFLCRICAESREIWKKSGAWFFKGMPKHDLPKKKERDWSRVGQRTLGQSSCKIISVCKSLESNEAQDSSSDEEATKRLIGARSCYSSSPSLQGIQDINGISKQQIMSYDAQTPNGFFKIKSRSNGYSSPTGHRDESSSTTTTNRLDKFSIHSQYSRLSSAATLRTSRTNEKSTCDQRGGSSLDDNASTEEIRLEDNGDEQSDFIDDSLGSSDQCKSSQVQSVRRNSLSTSPPSTLMERILEEAWMHEKNAEYEANCANQMNDAPISTWYVHHSSRQQTSDYLEMMRSKTEEGFGTLEISLLYDPVAQCLQCKVERALGLKPMDIHDLADPFCKITILPVGMGTNIKPIRTKTVHKTRDPVFNETVNFYVSRDADMKSGRALHVMILQDDPWGEDFLGEARFPLYELEPFQTKHYKINLQNHYPVNREEEAWGLHRGNRGQVQLTLSYCTRRRALLVIIHQAMNLLPMDNNGFSDPFLKLCLVENVIDNRWQRGHDPLGRNSAKKQSSKKLITGRSSYSTSVKWKTLNPEWNEEFIFGIRLTDLMKVTLCLSMWDKDFGKRNDYLGGLVLGCNSKGARLRHWVDVIKFPDYQHPAWHNLTEVLMPIE